jgi:hypothetical protein
MCPHTEYWQDKLGSVVNEVIFFQPMVFFLTDTAHVPLHSSSTRLLTAVTVMLLS